MNKLDACFLSLEDVPGVLKIGTLGESILGKRIPIATIGDERAERAVLYVGGHHGTEWLTALLLYRFIGEITGMAKNGAHAYRIHIPHLLTVRKIYVVPCLNPDGVAYSTEGVSVDNPLAERLSRCAPDGDFSHWQANARGVDLNHNYDASFSEYKEIEKEKGITEGATRYSGEYPESEPETRALAMFLRYHPEIAATLTLHSQGREIYYRPMGKTLPHADFLAKRIAKMTGYRIADPCGLSAYGGLTDWLVRTGRLSFTLECGEGENPLPLSDLFPVYTELRETLFTLPVLI